MQHLIEMPVIEEPRQAVPDGTFFKDPVQPFQFFGIGGQLRLREKGLTISGNK
jgi:hypothetical protein